MRKSAVVMPLVALIAGALGFIIRYLEVTTVFDSETGLAERGSPISYALIGLTLLVIAGAILFAALSSGKYRAESEFVEAFAPRGFLYIVVSFLIGFAWLAAVVLYYLNISAVDSVSVIDWVFVFLSALSAISVIFMARAAYKGKGGSEVLLFSVVPAIFFCFWLIILYKNNAANPVLLSYCYLTLAIAAAALSSYFTAGFVFNKAGCGKAIFCYLLSVYFSVVVLADNTDLPVKIIFGVTAINQFMNTVVFMRNLKSKKE